MSYRLDFWKLRFLKILHIPVGHEIKLAGYRVHFATIKHLTLLFKEIFVKKNYQCDMPDTPYIIDGGANIGLAVLYFKKHYPEAKVIAFEPNPESFKYLKKNVESNNLQNVEIHNAALGGQEGTIMFYTSTDMPEADIGASAVRQHVARHHEQKGEIRELPIKCYKLSAFVDSTVHLLKLDVEGSEGEIIRELDDRFGKVQNCIMEFHYVTGNTDNSLADILKVMEKNDHLYFLSPVGRSKRINFKSGYILVSRKNDEDDKAAGIR